MGLNIDGYCHPKFHQVEQAFREKMKNGEEIGASVSVVHDGETVVDLWGGQLFPKEDQPWRENTVVCVMSVSKSIGALCILMLADQGKLRLDHPVSEYWPEFAQGGKENVTVACVLAQMAGLPVVDNLPLGTLYDNYPLLINALAAQAPMWEPWSTPCYHSFTAGPLYSEIVRRVSGQSIGQFLYDEITGPLSIDFQFGLRPEDESRMTEVIAYDPIPSLEAILRDPDSLIGRAWVPGRRSETIPAGRDADFYNSKDWRQIEFPAGNGFSNARAIARLFGILARGGEWAGIRLLGKETLEKSIAEQWDAVEKITNRHFRFGLGFMLNNPVFRIGPNPRNFGHPGLGGALAFGDPEQKLGFGFCGNRLAGVSDSSTTDALVNAMYHSLK